MTYALFLGNRLGYESLMVLKDLVSIVCVFVEKEHQHENTDYFTQIVKQCEASRIIYSDELSKSSVEATLSGLRPDYILSFGYRRMISNTALASAKRACIGSHFAPLPRYRGFAPLNWVLINDEKLTAVNLFFLHDTVDSGDIIARESVDIFEEDDINTLTDRCIGAFKSLLKKSIHAFESGNLVGIKQNESEATYTCSRNPEDGEIDWRQSSRKIYNLVRALTFPMPGAFTYYNNQKVFIWKCKILDCPEYEGKICGKIVRISTDKTFDVLTGDGMIKVISYQVGQGTDEQNMDVIRSVRVTLGRKS